MDSEVTYRKANHQVGRTGKPFLQEVHSFGEQASNSLYEQDRLVEFDPWTIICEHLNECDEAIVAECDGRIIGASTLAFNGIGPNRMPILQGVYVLDKFRDHGVGLRLTELAMERFIEMRKTPVYCSASDDMQKTLDRLSDKRPDLSSNVRRV